MLTLFSKWSGADVGVGSTGTVVIDAVLLLLLAYCSYTDTTRGKIYNKATFSTMLAGLLLNLAFAGLRGLEWSLLGWCVGMAIQWVPYQLGFAKAGDVKLLAAVGALKGWAFCSFGFLYGAAAFGIMWLPKLVKSGELKAVGNNLKGYVATAAVTQGVPDMPQATVTRRFVPWGAGLSVGFVIALIMEIMWSRPTWIIF